MASVSLLGGYLSLDTQEASDRLEYLLEEDMLFEYISVLFNNSMDVSVSDIMQGTQKTAKQQVALFEEMQELKDIMLKQQKIVSDMANSKVVVTQQVSSQAPVVEHEIPVVKKAPKKAPGGKKKGGFGMGGRGLKKRTD